MNDGLVRVADDVRNISHHFHSSILDSLGLVEAIRSECASLSDSARIAVHYKHKRVPPVVPKEAALCLYRIAQESLRNVAKHAQAANVYVSVAGGDGSLLLSVRDDGAGFEVAQANRTRGMGLASMEERMQAIRGELSLESRPGKGTLIEARVPLPAGDK